MRQVDRGRAGQSVVERPCAAGLGTVALVLASIVTAIGGAGAGSGVLPAADPARGMSARDAARFRAGEAIFHAEWQPAPNVSEGVDGLGPLYNAVSCAACHGGPAAANPADRFGGRLLRLSRPDGTPDPVYGLQLQDRAVPGHLAEGRIAINDEPSVVRLVDGREVQLSRPRPAIADPAYGSPAADMALSLRVPPPLDGLGLVAAIEAAEIRALADPDDKDGDGISGRAGATVDPTTGKAVLARFGWKASVVTLAQQTAEALHLDMGISSSGLARHAGDCTLAQRDCLAAPSGTSAAAGGAEISDIEIGLLVAYLEGLPAPAQGRDPATAVASASGEQVFASSACTSCHRRSLPLAGRSVPEDRVPLFSDLLLHDMGEGLADNRPEGSASGSEWRTAPLWGLSRRLARMANGTLPGLLHDGRARTIEEAILWHGGEAARARDAYAGLSQEDRDNLLAFLADL